MKSVFLHKYCVVQFFQFRILDGSSSNERLMKKKFGEKTKFNKKKIGQKICLAKKKILPKNFWPKKIFFTIFFLNTFFDQQNLLSLCFCFPQKQILVDKHLFCTQHIFWPQNYFAQRYYGRIFFYQKIFLIINFRQIILWPKIIFDTFFTKVFKLHFQQPK